MKDVRLRARALAEPGLTLAAIAVAVAVAVALFASSGCNAMGTGGSTPVTSAKHSWFAINAGATHALGRDVDGAAVSCASCHPPSATTFTEITCTGCHAHEQSVTDRLHLSVATYQYGDGQVCYSCHAPTQTAAFDHAGIRDTCAMCHDADQPFAVAQASSHRSTQGYDCSHCHNTTDWNLSAGAPSGAHDPSHDLLAAALIPSYAGPAIGSVTPFGENLAMSMNHGSSDVPAAAFAACGNCHPHADQSVYIAGLFHASLAALQVGPLTGCGSCHADAEPTGFVGPAATSPARVPASGEMKHDAVSWANARPTGARIVPDNCGVCHLDPAHDPQTGWTRGRWTSGVTYHASLTRAGTPQPGSCLDCHANSRPAATLSSLNAALPPGVTFDHGALPNLRADCSSCHVSSSATTYSAWTQGLFHHASDAAPSTCLPCHANERPTATNDWVSASFRSAPFDYAGNGAGLTHGAGRDCVMCHRGPGTGAWGGSQTWNGGQFTHGPATLSATTCVACHSSQRPDLQPGANAAAVTAAIGFDHAANGAGDCAGCHQSAVEDAASRALTIGDWGGGQVYPGATLVGAPDQALTLTETTLLRPDPTRAIVGATTITSTWPNAMLHTSAALPDALAPGPAATPDNNKCWHCHAGGNNNGNNNSSGTTVTSYKNGRYHAALTTFSKKPGGSVSALPQPTAQCAGCHSSTVPSGVVEQQGSTLWPMDHGAVFATPVMIGGVTAASVADLDCSVCHQSPGATWADAAFHPNLGTAVVKDCAMCHGVLTSGATEADVRSGNQFAMAHADNDLPVQPCQTCHPGAITARAKLPATLALWQTGALHANLATQSVACNQCHAVSLPTGVATASSWSYALKDGATSSNGPQWMNHRQALVAGKDCGSCHAADATAGGSSWSRATIFHGPGVDARTCQECHGLTNGGGSVAGTNNNLPAGLTHSTTVATSSGGTTGIAPGTTDQMNHADINSAGHDCSLCHTQAGIAAKTADRGTEWAQASFHASFTGTTALVFNGTTGRCSNCHMNLRPGAGYAAQDHSAFTNASGSRDCGSCHTYAGSGTNASPNWLGATASPP